MLLVDEVVALSLQQKMLSGKYKHSVYSATISHLTWIMESNVRCELIGNRKYCTKRFAWKRLCWKWRLRLEERGAKGDCDILIVQSPVPSHFLVSSAAFLSVVLVSSSLPLIICCIQRWCQFRWRAAVTERIGDIGHWGQSLLNLNVPAWRMIDGRIERHRLIASKWWRYCQCQPTILV